MQDAAVSPRPLTAFSALSSVTFVVVELTLVVLVLERLDLLHTTVRLGLYGMFAWSAIHLTLVPSKHRRLASVFVTVVSLAVVLGLRPGPSWDFFAGVSAAALVVGAGAVLIAVARLRVNFWIRVCLLLGSAAAVATLRAGVFPVSEGSEFVWIAAAGFFMFRLMLYLYEVSTMKQLPSWRDTAGYFLMPPNVLFHNYPIVDFKTFLKCDVIDEVSAARRATARIARGAVQLAILRFVEQIHQAPDAVYSGKTLGVYLFTNMLGYLSISGTFHVILGVLLLLGFDLPRTHQNYFLSESFTDYWRRANTYWRNFLVKVFFYPVFFHLRRLPQAAAVAVATAAVFVMTWAFHVYQSWWLLGIIHLTWPDSLFWGLLGVLVIVNTLWELKARGTKKAGPDRRSILCMTAGTFLVICVAWSLATSPDLGTWLRLWSHIDIFTVLALMGLAGSVMVAKWWLELRQPATSIGRRWKPVLQLTALLGLTLLPSGLRGVEFGLGRFDPALSSARLFDALDDGQSLPVQTYAPVPRDEGWRQIMEVLTLRPIQPTLPDPLPVSAVRDYRLHVLPAGIGSQLQFEAASFSTNGEGDRDITPVEGAATHAVFLGGSAVMGWGIDDGNTFADQVDRTLGDELAVTNLGVHGFSLLSQVSVLAARGDALAPDILLVFGDVIDFRLSSYSLHETLRRVGSVPDAALAGILERARVEPRTRPRLAEKRLGPYERDIVGWSLQNVVALARELGAKPIFVILPTASRLAADLNEEAGARDLASLAAGAGMQVVDLSSLGGAAGLKGLIAGRVPFLNSEAHVLIANALVPVLRAVLRQGPVEVPPS